MSHQAYRSRLELLKLQLSLHSFIFFRLSCLSSIITEPAAWALGTIADDGPDLRGHVLSCGCLEPLLHLINSETMQKLSFLRTGMRTLSKLCTDKSTTWLKYQNNHRACIRDGTVVQNGCDDVLTPDLSLALGAARAGDVLLLKLQ